MAIAINSNFERDQYVAAGGQTQFTYSFPIFSDTYIKVYKRLGIDDPNDADDLLTLGTDYTVTGAGEEAGGYITLVVAATVGDIVTLVGEEPIERESVFEDQNPFTVALNQQLNESTVMAQQTYTYWNHVTPRYYFSELVSDEVRPLKRILPMLPDGYIWVGRGELGDDPDDIVTAPYGNGLGNVISTGTPMRQSIANWTGVATVITDSDLWINGYFIDRTIGSLGDRAGWADTWGAMHWPAHVTGGRPVAPANGDTYYDSTLNQFFGYENGAWVPFTTGAGSNNLIKRNITQALHGFTAGKYVRMTSPGGVWAEAIANNDVNAELKGLVVQVIDVNNFVLQEVGYVGPGVFTGLTPGAVYFLSDSALGDHSLVPATAPGTVRLPVFLAETATTGSLREFIGIINSGNQPLPTGFEGPDIFTFNQPGHTFTVGKWIRVGSDATYVLAQADSLANSQAVGVVIAVNGNNFTVQTNGRNIGSNTLDDAGNPFAPGEIYYLSRTVAGKLQAAAPTTGQVSKPCYSPETISINSGIILDQRPWIVGSDNPPTEEYDFVNCYGQDVVVVAAGIWTDHPCLEVTVQPLSVLDKFVLSSEVQISANTLGVNLFRITRNGTPLVGTGGIGIAANLRWGNTHTQNLIYVDAPNTVAAVTYKVQVYSSTANTFYFNRDQVGSYSGVSALLAEGFQ